MSPSLTFQGGGCLANLRSERKDLVCLSVCLSVCLPVCPQASKSHCCVHGTLSDCLSARRHQSRTTACMERCPASPTWTRSASRSSRPAAPAASTSGTSVASTARKPTALCRQGMGRSQLLPSPDGLDWAGVAVVGLGNGVGLDACECVTSARRSHADRPVCLERFPGICDACAVAPGPPLLCACRCCSLPQPSPSTCTSSMSHDSYNQEQPARCCGAGRLFTWKITPLFCFSSMGSALARPWSVHQLALAPNRALLGSWSVCHGAFPSVLTGPPAGPGPGPCTPAILVCLSDQGAFLPVSTGPRHRGPGGAGPPAVGLPLLCGAALCGGRRPGLLPLQLPGRSGHPACHGHPAGGRGAHLRRVAQHRGHGQARLVAPVGRPFWMDGWTAAWTAGLNLHGSRNIGDPSNVEIRSDLAVQAFGFGASSAAHLSGDPSRASVTVSYRVVRLSCPKGLLPCAVTLLPFPEGLVLCTTAFLSYHEVRRCVLSSYDEVLLPCPILKSYCVPWASHPPIQPDSS
jgi:hypothetical protein